MRTRWIVLALFALAATACTGSAVASPSPTVTPSPAVTTPPPTPSPSPTPVATTARPPTAQPTVSYVAGDRLIPLYFQIKPMFPLFPPTPVILPDEAQGVDENAVFRGLDNQGQPQFAVRADFVMDLGTAAHEMGHAYQKLLERKDPARDWLALYWAFRGFPGTWQQAQTQAQSQGDANYSWQFSPQESWAEAFRAAVTLQPTEKTQNYGKPIDPMAARQFFQSLATK